MTRRSMLFLAELNGARIMTHPARRPSYQSHLVDLPALLIVRFQVLRAQDGLQLRAKARPAHAVPYPPQAVDIRANVRDFSLNATGTFRDRRKSLWIRHAHVRQWPGGWCVGAQCNPFMAPERGGGVAGRNAIHLACWWGTCRVERELSQTVRIFLYISVRDPAVPAKRGAAPTRRVSLRLSLAHASGWLCNEIVGRASQPDRTIPDSINLGKPKPGWEARPTNALQNLAHGRIQLGQ
jgi:hypothetical protein